MLTPRSPDAVRTLGQQAADVRALETRAIAWWDDRALRLDETEWTPIALTAPFTSPNEAAATILRHDTIYLRGRIAVYSQPHTLQNVGTISENHRPDYDLAWSLYLTANRRSLDLTIFATGLIALSAPYALDMTQDTPIPNISWPVRDA